MTRKEEREQAARLYSPNNAHHTADTFEYGAEWADKTMLNKLDEAIEKLLSGLRNSNFGYSYGDSYDIDKLVEDFHKAMEGE